MSDKAQPPPPPPRPSTVTRVRFSQAVKLGAHELTSWNPERHSGYTASSSAIGVTFASIKPGESVTLVPWANILSVETYH